MTAQVAGCRTPTGETWLGFYFQKQSQALRNYVNRLSQSLPQINTDTTTYHTPIFKKRKVSEI